MGPLRMITSMAAAGGLRTRTGQKGALGSVALDYELGPRGSSLRVTSKINFKIMYIFHFGLFL